MQTLETAVIVGEKITASTLQGVCVCVRQRRERVKEDLYDIPLYIV